MLVKVLGGFDVKTYVHNDIPGKKKNLHFYLSGCPKGPRVHYRKLRGANHGYPL